MLTLIAITALFAGYVACFSVDRYVLPPRRKVHGDPVAWGRGFNAFLAGKTRDDCPYDREGPDTDTDSRTYDWDSGWWWAKYRREE